jgi:hypothetical protein
MPSLPTRHVAAPRITLLVGLLTLTVVLAASLAYEAHDAARSHRVTADAGAQGLRVRCSLEYVANAQDRLGEAASELLSPVTSVRASSPYELLAPPDLVTASRPATCSPASPECRRFGAPGVPGRPSRWIRRSGGGVADTGFVRWLRDTVVTKQPAAVSTGDAVRRGG